MPKKDLITSGLLIGIGMGGFVDGILFHQILQTHNMLSAKIPVISLLNAEINMVWDGIFHILTWIMTAFGIYYMWRACKVSPNLSGKTWWGASCMGWGLFNFIEGIVDHHILHLHHVVESIGVSIFDYLFLLSGIVLCVLGSGLLYQDRNLH